MPIQETIKENVNIGRAPESSIELEQENNKVIQKITDLNATSSSLLPNRMMTHHRSAGLNPLADAAAHLFSILGKLKQLTSCRQLNKLQKELIQEVNLFHETIINQGYNTEYAAICRYIICATTDDIINHTVWGGQNQWEPYSLLAAFNQDIKHQDKFFIILDRVIKEQALYIDLMELMYLCLNLGYKGQYRSTEHSQFQLEQITNNLYKHIQSFRGNFSRTLSPTPFKITKFKKKNPSKNGFSPLFILLMTIYGLLILFASLNYLTDIISNETYQTITASKNLDSH